MNVLERAQPLALLVLRLVLGAILIAVSYHKVFGGLHQYVELMRTLHIPGWLAYVSAFVEFGGGILLVLGLFSRLAAFAVLMNMLVAISSAQMKHGFVGPNNYQFPLALAAMAFALFITGPGPIAADWLFETTSR